MTHAEQIAMKAGARAAKKGSGKHEHGYVGPKQYMLVHYFKQGWVEAQQEWDDSETGFWWCKLCDTDHDEKHQCPQHPDYDPTP